MGAMADLVDAGKVRHVGVSNFSVREMEAAEAMRSARTSSSRTRSSTACSITSSPTR